MGASQVADPAIAGSAAGLAAAQLAARIEIPRRLPPRYDGQPLAHLSHSSVTRFWLCPEFVPALLRLRGAQRADRRDVPRPSGR